MNIVLYYLPIAALFIAGTVHLVISPDHFSHTPAHGLFFAGIGAAQVIWATACLWFRDRTPKLLTISGVLLSGGVAAIWVLTHYVAMPFTTQPHPVDITAAITKAAELITFAVLVYRNPFLVASKKPTLRFLSQPIMVSLVAAVGVWGFTLLIAPLLPGLAEDPNHGHGAVTSAYRTTTAYFSIVNSGKADETLISITEPTIGKMKLYHSASITQNPDLPELSGVTLKPHTRVDFSPAENYVLMTNLRMHMFRGTTVTLNLNFASGRSIPVTFNVESVPPEGRLNFVAVDGFQVTNAWIPATATFDGLVTSAQGDYVWQLPADFPLPAVPDSNPMTQDKVELGRYLFYDTRLSGNNTYSCSSCHIQALAFSDGRPVAVGSTGEFHPRNSMALVNVAYNTTLTWANPTLLTLEKQIPVPMFGEHPVEMGITGHEDEILSRFRQDTTYQKLFAAAYPDQTDPVTFNNVTLALASFVRTLISGNSSYDRYVQGDTTALSESAQRGMKMFFSEDLECHHCHTGFNFTLSTTIANSMFEDRPFFNTGLYNVDGAGAYPKTNQGIYEITHIPSDMGRFRPPTLRNIALTAPYMHDGSIATLPEVIQFYASAGRVIAEGENAGDGRANPYKSGLVPGFRLSDDQVSDLVAFLESLTDESFVTDPRFSSPFSQSSSVTQK